MIATREVYLVIRREARAVRALVNSENWRQVTIATTELQQKVVNFKLDILRIEHPIVEKAIPIIDTILREINSIGDYIGDRYTVDKILAVCIRSIGQLGIVINEANAKHYNVQLSGEDVQHFANTAIANDDELSD